MGRPPPAPLPAQVSGLSRCHAIRREFLFPRLLGDGTVWAWGPIFWPVRGWDHHGPAQPRPGLRADRCHRYCSWLLPLPGCASDGTVWAWGGNASGELGDGTTVSHSIPAQVPGLAAVSAVAASHSIFFSFPTSKTISYSLAMRSDGTVWPLGLQCFRQIGRWDNHQSTQPCSGVRIVNISAIAAGSIHSLALRKDGSVWAWGSTFNGQLGDGVSGWRPSVIQVPGLSNVTAISAGGSHSLAISSTKLVTTWGDNSSGQLGDAINHWPPHSHAALRAPQRDCCLWRQLPYPGCHEQWGCPGLWPQRLRPAGRWDGDEPLHPGRSLWAVQCHRDCRRWHPLHGDTQ